MSLTLLAIMVPVGIGLITLAVHLTGGSRRAALADTAAAGTRFARDHPDLAVDAAFLTADGYTAFLALRDGRIGVVQSIGSKFLTRVVAASDIAAAPVSDGNRLTLHFRDVTWRGGVYVFSDPATASAVASLFTPSIRHRMRESA